jgi:hypothetical protein
MEAGGGTWGPHDDPEELQMISARRTAVLYVLAAAALAAPAAAAARPAPTPSKGPLLAVTLKGTQVSTWEHKHDSQGPCDATVRGNGSQQVSYDLLRPIKLKLVVPERGRATLALPKDTLAQHGFPGFAIPFRAVATREGSSETIQAPGGACDGTGGWNGVRPDEDCDEKRYGRLDSQLGYAAYSGGRPPRDGHFQVAGRYGNFLDDDGFIPQPAPTEPSEGKALPLMFEHCPYWAAGEAGPSSNQLVPASAKLPLRKLRALAKGRTAKASGHKRTDYAEGDFKGDTLHTWNIKIKRIR